MDTKTLDFLKKEMPELYAYIAPENELETKEDVQKSDEILFSEELPSVTRQKVRLLYSLYCVERSSTRDKILDVSHAAADTDDFVSLTGIDEENVLLSLYAKEVTDAKIITKIDRNSFNELIAKLDLDTVIYPCDITTELILQYVRTKQNAMGNNVENLYKLVEDKVEALEFKIGENAPIIGIPLQDMELKDNLIICGIIHSGRFTIPHGESTVAAGDRIIVVTSHKKLNDVGDILK